MERARTTRKRAVGDEAQGVYPAYSPLGEVIKLDYSPWKNVSRWTP